jgi:hypothetical protein
VCSPLVFKNNGDVNLNTRIEPQLSGSDSCVARNTAGAVVATQPSQALFLPGDDPTQFRREVRAWGRRVRGHEEGLPLPRRRPGLPGRCVQGRDLPGRLRR